MQKNATISEMNEVIALFMGMDLKQDKDDPGFEWEWINGPSKSFWPSKTPPPFNTSWDWLMPVVEKIELMEWCIRVENWPKKFKSPYKEHYSVWMWLSKIEAVFNAVYQFITWYNKQTMSNKELSASYTKGEWYLQEYTDAYTNIIRCNKGNGFETIFIGYTGQNSSPETRANARLMAASPDLLEALQGIIEITDRDHAVWHKAKAAIVKAIGSDNENQQKQNDE